MAKVITRDESGLRPPRSVTSLPIAEVDGLVFHWSGSMGDIKDHSLCDDIVRGWQNKHMAPGGLGTKNGAADAAYTEAYCPHGFVYLLRGPGVRTGANGSSKCNEKKHALVAFGGPDYTPTEIQVETARERIRLYLTDYSGAGDEVLPHSSCKPTQCCGDYWRGLIANRFWEGNVPIPAPPPSPPTPPAPVSPPWPGIYLKQGMMNSPYVRDGQRKMAARGWKIAVDGDFGAETKERVKELQREKRQWMLDNGATPKQAADDGIIGPWTWRAIWESPVTR